ncbi:MAG: LamG-like jellyroll fold domain-containing protein [Phycisphaeraceae bacterium]
MKSRRIGIVLTALAVALVQIAPAQGALLFNAGTSTVTYSHDVIDDGGLVNRTVTVPTPAIPAGSSPGIFLSDLTLTGTADGVPTLSSRAKAGFGHLEAFARGTGVIAANTLITQVDPGNASDFFSELTITFDLDWTVTAPGFGPPIIASFSIPVLGVVGTGGAAEVEVIDMQWLRNGVMLRSDGNALVSMTAGTTLTTLNVPAAATIPTKLNTGDTYSVTGSIKFRVKNDTSPVSVYADPDYQSYVLDDAQNPPTAGGNRIILRFDEAPPGAPAPGVAQDSAIAIDGAQNAQYLGGITMAQGLKGSGALLDGNNDAIQGMINNTTQAFTAEIWAASAGALWNADGWLVNAGDMGRSNGFEISPHQGTKQWEGIIYDAAGNPFSIGVFDPASDDITQLHHYAISYNGVDTAAMYYDGALVGMLDVGIARSNGAMIPLMIGQGFGAAQFGAGLVDEFAYYPFALRPEQIEARFLLGSYTPPGPDSPDRIIGIFLETEVPEPATVSLFALALMGLGARRRRSHTPRASVPAAR